MSEVFGRAEGRLAGRSAAAAGADLDVGHVTLGDGSLLEVMRRIASGLMEVEHVAAWEVSLERHANAALAGVAWYLLGLSPGRLQAQVAEDEDFADGVKSVLCTLHAALGQQTVLGLLLAEEMAAVARAQGDLTGPAPVPGPPAFMSAAAAWAPAHGGFPGFVV